MCLKTVPPTAATAPCTISSWRAKTAGIWNCGIDVAMGSEAAQGLLWGVEPDGWASHESNHSPLFRAMMEATSIGSDKHVLDIGCGAGHSTALINATGASVVGVDAAQGMVDYANKTFDGIDFRVGGLEELAFGDDEFDVVFAANSVHYAADLGTALGEVGEGVQARWGSIVAGLFGPPEAVSLRPFSTLSGSSCQSRLLEASPAAPLTVCTRSARRAIGLGGTGRSRGSHAQGRRAADRRRRQHRVRHERVHLRRRAGLNQHHRVQNLTLWGLMSCSAPRDEDHSDFAAPRRRVGPGLAVVAVVRSLSRV